MRTATTTFAKQAIASLIALFFLTAGIAQNDYTVKYRVTAYKKGDNSVTSTSNLVEMVPPLAVYVPNSFTPNDDGLNDKFGAFGEGIVEYQLQVYNVWGNLVFESKSAKDQWDGKHNGLLCAEGAYTYMLVAKGEKDKVRKSGTITLIM